MFRRSINTLLLPGIVACLLVLIPSCALLDHVAVYIVNCAQDNVRIQGPLGTNLHLTLSSVCSENEREYLTALDNNIWVREFSLNRSVGGCLQTMTIALPDGPGIDFIEEEIFAIFRIR